VSGARPNPFPGLLGLGANGTDRKTTTPVGQGLANLDLVIVVSAAGVVKRAGWGVRSCGRSQGDGEAEGFELADVVAGGAGVVDADYVRGRSFTPS
jgi:hypothetical protein